MAIFWDVFSPARASCRRNRILGVDEAWVARELTSAGSIGVGVKYLSADIAASSGIDSDEFSGSRFERHDVLIQRLHLPSTLISPATEIETM